MSFSRLLLADANSQKYILGEKNTKVCISPKAPNADGDVYAGEVILCFQVDLVAQSLRIPKKCKRCDGLVFYFQDGETDRVVCLVEMKSTYYVEDADEQISDLKEYLEATLHKECDSLRKPYATPFRNEIKQIIWKACLYHNCSSLGQTRQKFLELKNKGFKQVGILTGSKNDLRPLLTGEEVSAEEM